VSEFLQGPWAIVIFAALCIGCLVLFVRSMSRSTKPPGNQPNTGERYEPPAPPPAEPPVYRPPTKKDQY